VQQGEGAQEPISSSLIIVNSYRHLHEL